MDGQYLAQARGPCNVNLEDIDPATRTRSWNYTVRVCMYQMLVRRKSKNEVHVHGGTSPEIGHDFRDAGSGAIVEVCCLGR